jgi:hypothetical protein
MFIVCIAYVSYVAFPGIPLHSVITGMGNNGHSAPLLVSFNEGCMLNKQWQANIGSPQTWKAGHEPLTINMACYKILHGTSVGVLLWTC